MGGGRDEVMREGRCGVVSRSRGGSMGGMSEAIGGVGAMGGCREPKEEETVRRPPKLPPHLSKTNQ